MNFCLKILLLLLVAVVTPTETRRTNHHKDLEDKYEVDADTTWREESKSFPENREKEDLIKESIEAIEQAVDDGKLLDKEDVDDDSDDDEESDEDDGDDSKTNYESNLDNEEDLDYDDVNQELSRKSKKYSQHKKNKHHKQFETHKKHNHHHRQRTQDTDKKETHHKNPTTTHSPTTVPVSQNTTHRPGKATTKSKDLTTSKITVKQPQTTSKNPPKKATQKTTDKPANTTANIKINETTTNSKTEHDRKNKSERQSKSENVENKQRKKKHTKHHSHDRDLKHKDHERRRLGYEEAQKHVKDDVSMRPKSYKRKKSHALPGHRYRAKPRTEDLNKKTNENNEKEENDSDNIKYMPPVKYYRENHNSDVSSRISQLDSLGEETEELNKHEQEKEHTVLFKIFIDGKYIGKTEKFALGQLDLEKSDTRSTCKKQHLISTAHEIYYTFLGHHLINIGKDVFIGHDGYVIPHLISAVSNLKRSVEFNFKEKVILHAILMKPNHVGRQRRMVTKFTLALPAKNNQKKWTILHDDHKVPLVFKFIRSKKQNLWMAAFNEPLMTKSVRIYPQQWQGEAYIRVAFIGCTSA